MEQLRCKYCANLFVPRKYKHGAPKYCNRTCYTNYMRCIEEAETVIVVPVESDRPFYIKLFFFLVLVSVFIVMFINRQC